MSLATLQLGLVPTGPKLSLRSAYYRDPTLMSRYAHRTYTLDLDGCCSFEDLRRRLKESGLIEDDAATPDDFERALRQSILQGSTGTHITIDWIGRLCDGHPDFPDRARIEYSLAYCLSEIMRTAEEEAADGHRSPVLEVNIQAPVFNLPRV